MFWIEVFLLAVSLSFDTFAVSAAGSQSISRASVARLLLIALVFGLFQGGFTLLGWGCGTSLSRFIFAVDHWVAFVLLAYVGGKMVFDSVADIRCGDNSQQRKRINLLSSRTLAMSAAATSIDAMAVGVSLAVIGRGSVEVFGAVAVIAAVTVTASLLGIFFGRVLGKRFGNYAQLAGGCVLIFIGVKILLEHTLLA